MTRPILIHPDPRLKTRALQIGTPDAETRALAAEMLETMYDAPGIGLAGPQIGVMRRIFVMDCAREKGADPRPMVLIDPVIEWVSDETNTHEERCLSIPGYHADIERPAEIEVSWTDPSGPRQRERFSGLWATCAQHEIDHLDGKLFIDHLSPVRRQMITRSLRKMKREKVRR